MSVPKHLKKEFRHLEIVAEHRADKIGSAAFYTLDVIDGKTQSLLTHVSIMMAILAVIYSDGGVQGEIRLAILIELILYLAVTLGCLRAVFIVAPSRMEWTTSNMLEVRVRECARRRTAYRVSLFVTIAVTLAFLVTIAIHATKRAPLLA